MVENRPWLTVFSHAALIAGIAVIAFPLYITFVASTLTLDQIVQVPMPLVPGSHFFENYYQVLTAGSHGGASAPVGRMMLNSLVMAVAIAFVIQMLTVGRALRPIREMTRAAAALFLIENDLLEA